MHQAQRLRIAAFGEDALAQLTTPQARYLREYLAELGATTVVEEPHYFDRDYLSEFAALYAGAARGYSNVCRRLHFFEGIPLTRASLRSALAGGVAAARVQSRYLGFVVLRPLPKAPLGRTVLKWYPDPNASSTPRITEPAREYRVHLAGLELQVRGLAWQQQDAGVSACATVALWSMLHSSAFDDHHAIPTTAAITRLAHARGASSSRVFPSKGLRVEQMCEAIREAGLEPTVAPGDRKSALTDNEGFSRSRFASISATFLRGGYPVIVGGALLQKNASGEWIDRGGHAVCAVGFREAAPVYVAGALVLQDDALPHVYLHDDNIGPSSRFSLEEDESGVAVLYRSPPSSVGAPRYAIVPTTIVAAVHENIRASNDAIHARALEAGRAFLMNVVISPPLELAVTVRFARIASYMAVDLSRTLRSSGRALSRARLELTERVPPMSLYVGVARVGHPGGPAFDVLFDTTDNDNDVRTLATVAFHQNVGAILETIRDSGIYDYGTIVRGFA